jgi:PAS domain-containing protein
MPNPTSDSATKAPSRADGTPVFFRTLLDAIPGFVLLSNSDGNVVYFNRAVAVAGGWDQAERENRHQLRDLIAPEVIPRLLESGNSAPARSVLQTADSANTVVEWSTRTMGSETGELFLLTGHDVSRESELEGRF